MTFFVLLEILVVDSIFLLFYFRLETIPPFPLQELLRCDLYFSAPVQTLIILRRLRCIATSLIPFLVPIILSVHIYP